MKILKRVLIATIRDKGTCSCPRCLITKNRLGKGITSKVVEDILKETSSVPTMVSSNDVLDCYTFIIAIQNVFVDRLGEEFDVHSMLVVDLMHEFQLGVWKSLFTHLIRILHATAPNGSQVAELDER